MEREGTHHWVGCVASTTQHGIQPGRARVRAHGRARREERRKIDEKIALRARVMLSIRRKGRTQCGLHRRDSRRTRKVEEAASKTAGCRPLQTLCSRKKAIMT